MTPAIAAVVEALLSSPALRGLVEGIAVKCIGEIFHRRSTDPAFLAASDATFSKLAAAKTDEELKNAQLDLQRLMSTG